MSLFFARVGAARGLLRNAHEMHRALWSLYPDYGGERPRMLYRVENWDARALRDDDDLAPVLVLAPDAPSGSTTEGDISVFGVKPFAPNLREGAVLAFSIVAHPTRAALDTMRPSTEAKSEWKRGSRIFISTDAGRREWLARQLAPAARLLEARVTDARSIYFAKPTDSGSYRSCRMSGLIEVQDPAALVKLIGKGLGKGKAYGCGLLTLGRPS